MSNKLKMGLITLVGLLLVIFTLWYSGGTKPLSSIEVDDLIGKIQNQTQKPGGQHDIPALRQFLSEDDGQPFYTVNLYKYYAQAKYVQDGGVKKEFTGTGRQAYDRFSQIMVRLLIKQASHPIFGSDWVGGNINEWDRLVIVRYRSRRDIAQIFASDEFAQASTHKWAGLEKNQRLLVQGLHIPELFLLGLLGLLVLGIQFYVLFARITKKAKYEV